MLSENSLCSHESLTGIGATRILEFVKLTTTHSFMGRVSAHFSVMIESILVNFEERRGWRFTLLSTPPALDAVMPRRYSRLGRYCVLERLVSLSGRLSKPGGWWQRAVRKLGKELHYYNPLVRIFVGAYERSVGLDEFLLQHGAYTMNEGSRTSTDGVGCF